MLIGTTVTIYVPIYLQHRSHPSYVSCSFFIQSCCSQNERQCSCKQAFFRYFYCRVIIFYYPSSKYRMIHSLITDSIRFCISVFFDWKKRNIEIQLKSLISSSNTSLNCQDFYLFLTDQKRSCLNTFVELIISISTEWKLCRSTDFFVKNDFFFLISFLTSEKVKLNRIMILWFCPAKAERFE